MGKGWVHVSSAIIVSLGFTCNYMIISVEWTSMPTAEDRPAAFNNEVSLYPDPNMCPDSVVSP
jgi:hypothetical protein